MSRTTTSPEGFIDHVDEPFLRTWALLEYLTCLAPVDTPGRAAVGAELAFAYDTYTEHGLHRPAPDVEVPLPNLVGGDVIDLEPLLRDLDSLLLEQLHTAGSDLALALRLRRAHDQVRHAQTALSL